MSYGWLARRSREKILCFFVDDKIIWTDGFFFLLLFLFYFHISYAIHNNNSIEPVAMAAIFYVIKEPHRCSHCCVCGPNGTAAEHYEFTNNWELNHRITVTRISQPIILCVVLCCSTASSSSFTVKHHALCVCVQSTVYVIDSCVTTWWLKLDISAQRICNLLRVNVLPATIAMSTAIKLGVRTENTYIKRLLTFDGTSISNEPQKIQKKIDVKTNTPQNVHI